MVSQWDPDGIEDDLLIFPRAVSLSEGLGASESAQCRSHTLNGSAPQEGHHEFTMNSPPNHRPILISYGD